jgi:hypothetical protein
MATRFTSRFVATIDKHGKPHLHDKAAWDAWMWAHAGRKIEIAPKRWVRPRSLKQLRAYFGLCVRAISDKTGYELLEVHKQIKEATGIDSTKTLTTEEMEEVREFAIRWAAQDLELVLPDPTEVSL